MMTSLLEYLDRDWEMTVLPHPKAPGIAVVPPCTHLERGDQNEREMDGGDSELWRANRETERERDRERNRDREREKERERDRDRDTERDTERETQRETQRERDTQKECIQDPLASQQGVIGRKLLCYRTHLSHRPHLNHGELLLEALKLQLQHHILTHTHTQCAISATHFQHSYY